MKMNFFKAYNSSYIKDAASNSYERPSEEEKRTLHMKIGQHEYGDEGVVETETEKISLRFEYEYAEYRDYAYGPDEIDGVLGNRDPSIHWRKLKCYTLRDKDTGAEVDLLGELPDGYVVLFNSASYHDDGEARPRYKGCVVDSEISSIHGIIVLLHEIGHCIDYEKTEDKRKWIDRIETAESEKDIQLCLRRERDASAYVVKKLRSFLNSGALSKAAVMNHIYEAIFVRNDILRKRLGVVKLNEIKDYFKKILDKANSMPDAE